MEHTPSDILCDEDQRAVDRLLTHAFNADALPADADEREKKVAQLMGLLDHLPAEDPPDDLVERTLAHIERSRQQERFSQQIQSMSGSGSPGWHWTELIAVAAMVLIGISILVPTLRQSQNAADQYRCRNNLAAAGMGISSYASMNNGQMPALPVRAGDTWWNVNQFNEDGTPRSNSAHVFLLIRRNYVQPADLACPSNPTPLLHVTNDMRDFPSDKNISFSYLNMFTDRPMNVYGPTMPMLGDKNPLFGDGQFNRDLATTGISQNHADMGGQNALLSSGNAIWLRSPVLNNGDNIYEIRGRRNYQGNETPGDRYDSFLVP